jgi:hypothetical protein
VHVGLLPADARWSGIGAKTGIDPTDTSHPSPMTTVNVHYGYLPAGSTAPDRSAPNSSGQMSSESVTVQVGRGGAPNLDHLAALYKGATWTQVSGRRALLLPGDSPVSSGRGLAWVADDPDGKPVLLIVEGTGGQDMLRQVAAGLAVGRAPAGPADPAAQTAAVRTAVATAFDGAALTAAPPAVQDGDTLRPLLATAQRTYPALSKLVGHAGPVLFLDASTAWVTVSLSVPPGVPISQCSRGRDCQWSADHPLTAQDTALILVKTGGAWQIRRGDYCLAMNLGCPGAIFS